MVPPRLYKYAENAVLGGTVPGGTVTEVVKKVEKTVPKSPSLLDSLGSLAALYFFFPEIPAMFRNMGFSYSGQFRHPLKDTNTTYQFLTGGSNRYHPLSDPRMLDLLRRRPQ